jgi:hypothetical protein
MRSMPQPIAFKWVCPDPGQPERPRCSLRWASGTRLSGLHSGGAAGRHLILKGPGLDTLTRPFFKIKTSRRHSENLDQAAQFS